VFTDLDGSLLDHDDYSFAAAAPTLALLERLQVPVIPVTSKTRAEVEALRTALVNTHPFIVENGAGVFIPDGYFPRQPEGTSSRDGYWVYETSAPRAHWLQLLAGLADDFPGEFTGFYAAGPEGIALMTGLGPAAAALANSREYSEPVHWRGTDSRKREFIDRLRDAGANPLQGGRFLAVAGDCDKGRALAWLRAVYRSHAAGVALLDLAAGDSGNDVAMLEAAGTALLIRSPAHPLPALARATGVYITERCGPAGWAEGVEAWLRRTETQG
jgi:mannosyl-3-phosphoglycerate phosphatase family protein